MCTTPTALNGARASSSMCSAEREHVRIGRRELVAQREAASRARTSRARRGRRAASRSSTSAGIASPRPGSAARSVVSITPPAATGRRPGSRCGRRPSDASHATVSATSTGSPPWRSEFSRRPASRTPIGIAAVIAVSMNPGATALIVIPPAARRSATRSSSPAFDRRVVRLPGVAGDRAQRRHADDPPVVAHDRQQRRRDPLGREQVDLHQRLPALLGHLRQRAVLGHARVVDEHVEPVREPLGEQRGRVRRGDVELDVRRRSSRTTDAPSRSSTSAIAAPIPREAPVTSARAAGQRRVRARRRRGSTWPDTYAERGESRNRSVASMRAPSVDVHEVDRRPAPDLLAERAREALQRTPPVAEHDHAPGRLDAPDGRMEEALQLDQLGAPVASNTSALNAGRPAPAG